jgi:hypothetical protein
MSKRFPVLLTSALIALALPFIGCDIGGGKSAVAVTGVTVNPATLALQIDKTRQLSAAAQPNNATNKDVTWSSSNTGVADVSSSGLVTAKAVGEATITATTQDGGKTASCAVSVTLYDPVNEVETVKVLSEPFLMPIEDVFTITGRDVVVTGRVERGVVRVGDEIEIVGGGKPTKRVTVAGIEMFRKLLDQAEVGDNVGVLIKGIEKPDITRGQVLAEPGSVR